MSLVYILFLIVLFIKSSYMHIMDMNGYLYSYKHLPG